MTATFHVGDAIAVMNTLPEKSVDLVLTSPPFLALRSYLPADHPDKHLEGGSQATPGAYIDWLVDVVEACDRILAPHGSLCIELGDTYAGSGGAGGDYAENGLREGQPVFRQVTSREHRPEREGTGADGGSRVVPPSRGRGWPLAKSLSLIPELFRLTLVYGTNPLTGRQTDRWRLRNVVRWVRPNPPVGALGDKFRPATSELMVFCKSAKRFFDLDAVREPHKSDPTKFTGNGYEKGRPEGLGVGTISEPGFPAGAPPLDWWNIPLLEGEEETRYGPKEKERSNEAPMGQKRESARIAVGLSSGSNVERGTMMLNPAGAPPLDWWKIPRCSHLRHPCEHGRYERHRIHEYDLSFCPGGEFLAADGSPLDWWNIPPGGYTGAHYAVWPPELLIRPIKAMCPIGGTVLDPFAGSGTTLAVATGHGRDAIGIDLDERNYQLALERVGPLILQRGEVAA